MNDRVKIIRDGREHDVPLRGRVDFDLDGLQARVVGRTLVLEPIAESGGIAPGTYTKETLPPLSEKARKILESVDAAAARFAAAGEAPARSAAGPAGAIGIALEDEGEPGISLSDEGLSGIDPGP